ncbi:MAG: V-type ATP synthase alpha chain [Candidatus Heimdallarchaeota archaeon LC_3]|nr:MAG: V-type ATP synthase alpha chain [Candidatus Heimdallarchaeota archaeon LC_3]
MAEQGTIIRIAGPVVDVSGLTKALLYEVVRVGNEKLVGEIIKIQINPSTGDHVSSVQVYEQTEGIRPGEPVVGTGLLLSVELGPGILESFFDGIQRPLNAIAAQTGDFIKRGIVADPLDHERKWEFVPTKKEGDETSGSTIIGVVQETKLIEHRILIPPNVKPGKIKSIKQGSFNVTETVAVIETEDGDVEVKLAHYWPVRVGRPVKNKLPANVPLITGQRIFDTMFPIAKGGTGAIPGAFGTGKTVAQHQLAKWSDAKVVVYIGCGERGNEMAEVLKEFPKLRDPYTNEPLMLRTTLIANTSNMPVAAREASIYTGITLAEYYRDQGHDVSVMADSTSRWAEALREISGRMEEMPGEESFPAYLPSRIAQFYERSGRVVTLNGDEASITIIGAVSPPGGDFSEPVTQYTLRTCRVFWGLSKPLANARHFPAIDWLDSYSLYTDSLSDWFAAKIAPDFPENRIKAMSLLQKEKELQEIVQLIGEDALPDSEKIVLRVTRLIREAFLQQNAYSSDSFCTIEKQYKMLKAIHNFNTAMNRLFQEGATLENMMDTFRPQIIDINNFKWMEDEFEEKYAEVMKTFDEMTISNLQTAV